MRIPAFAIALLLIAGCNPKPKPTTLDMAPPAPPPNYTICDGNPQVTSADVCDGYFTGAGYPCARCMDFYGCVTTDAVYCVVTTGDCAQDIRCTLQQFGKHK